MKYTSGEFADLIRGTRYKEFDDNITLSRYLSDSRKAEGEGNLFVALRGDRFDGHSFVETITANGKNVALIEDEAFMTKNTVLVPDVRKALYSLALSFREKALCEKKCVAITGSVGKTSTKEYTNAVFSSEYNVYKSPGNQNSYTGLPMVILNCDEKSEYMVLELGMNTAGEIAKLSALTKPDVGIITNIGWSHSEYLGGRENIFREKLDITKGMSNGLLVVNGDDDMLRTAKGDNFEVIKCSVKDSDADFYCSRIEEQDGVISFWVDGKKLSIRQAGEHNVKNALLAYAAGISCGASHSKAQEALYSLDAKEGRMKVRKGKNGCIVIEDCYNAAPESMKAALDYLKKQNSRRVAVLGDMLELGKTEKELHINVGEHASLCCDEIVCFGELGKYIAIGAENAGHKNVKYFSLSERESFLEYLEGAISGECAVLFKASNRMRFPDVVKELDI